MAIGKTVKFIIDVDSNVTTAAVMEPKIINHLTYWSTQIVEISVLDATQLELEVLRSAVPVVRDLAKNVQGISRISEPVLQTVNLGQEILAVDIPDIADVAGGNTQTVSFSIVDENGDPKKEVVMLEFGVFADINLSTFPNNAKLGIATKGTIIAGEDTAALKVKTDANGEFECTLTDIEDETLYLGCSPTFGGPIIACVDVEAITFT